LEKRTEQVLPGSKEGRRESGGREQGEEIALTMYTHMNKLTKKYS
jgi:hypothetical protein